MAELKAKARKQAQVAKEMAKQVGSMSGKFSQRLSEAQGQMDGHTRQLLIIFVYPSLITLRLEPVPQSGGWRFQDRRRGSVNPGQHHPAFPDEAAKS